MLSSIVAEDEFDKNKRGISLISLKRSFTNSLRGFLLCMYMYRWITKQTGTKINDMCMSAPST